MNINSLYAYQSVNLTLRQAQVLEAFRDGGEYTDVEIGQKLNWPINRVCGRVGELLKAEKIVKLGNRDGARVCRIISQETLF
jgi:DNA-binding MarR family transcriptional regulator